MIHYTYSSLKIEAWKILGPEESLGMGQDAEGEGSRDLFWSFMAFPQNPYLDENGFEGIS